MLKARAAAVTYAEESDDPYLAALLVASAGAICDELSEADIEEAQPRDRSPAEEQCS